MAAMAAQNPTGGAPAGLPMPSRNPLPLSASQEAQIRDIYHARVRNACAPEIKGSLPSFPTHTSLSLFLSIQLSETTSFSVPQPFRTPSPSPYKSSTSRSFHKKKRPVLVDKLTTTSLLKKQPLQTVP